jgi:multicomponent Na+:H+ antiporter subunit C
MEYFKTMSVDPLPQAMVLISIVTGLGTLILMVALAIRLYQRYGTFDITEMNRLKK